MALPSDDKIDDPSPSTILVVEDEAIIRTVVVDYLEACGYRVLEAATGEDARRMFLDGERIDVLFSDINLGAGISGFVLAAWVRERYPAVRIIVTSGVEKIADEAHDLCDSPLLRKPYSYPHLKDLVGRLLAATGIAPKA